MLEAMRDYATEEEEPMIHYPPLGHLGRYQNYKRKLENYLEQSEMVLDYVETYISN